MYIREVKKQRSKDSSIFYQYTLAQTYRLDGKVKQRSILYLGSSPLFRDKANRNTVLKILKSRIFKQVDLFPVDCPKELLELAENCFEKYCVKYAQQDELAVSIPPSPERSDYQNVDLNGLELKDVRTFGAEHLCKQILEKLEFRSILSAQGMKEEQIRKALISIAARAIFSSSEHKTAQILSMNSELAQCFDHQKVITHKQLYSIADKLYENKEAIDKLLYNRIKTMFDLNDKLVIFDISNTYFQSRKPNSKIAERGRCKSKRNDCPLVVFTGVINSAGFIRHSRIYEGNKADTTTLPDMLEDLEKYTSSETIPCIVMDAGIATEENLELINKKQYNYVCVSRKRLKDYPLDQSSTKMKQLTDRGKNKVELAIFKPEGYSDTWMYVQSEAKRKKEESMTDKLRQRFEQDIDIIRKALSSKGGTKRINKVWERIGRAKQKHNRVSAQYDIKVTENEEGKAIKLELIHKPRKDQDDKKNGVYFIRTNYDNPDEKQLWDIYNTIRDVEATFKCLKSDLNIRPVHHQNDDRIKAHIYLTILAYQLVNTIRHMLKIQGIHLDWNNIVRILNTQTIQNIIIPTQTKQIHIRKPSTPIQEVKQIFKATSCSYSQEPTKKYVVYH